MTVDELSGHLQEHWEEIREQLLAETHQPRMVERRVRRKTLQAMKDHVRLITKRTGGRSVVAVAAELRSYLVGWNQYYRLADTPGIFSDLDEWIRHRLRALHLKQWKQGTTIYR